MNLDDYLSTFGLVTPAQRVGHADEAFLKGLNHCLAREGLPHFRDMLPGDPLALSALFVQETLHPALCEALGEAVGQRMLAAVAAKADPLA